MKKKEAEIAQDYPKEKKKKKKSKIVIIVILIAVLGALAFLISNQAKEEEDIYQELSRQELIERIELLEAQNQSLQDNIKEMGEEQQVLLRKIDNLSEYETNYTQFVEDKRSWDSELAREAPELYIKHFEEVEPELANQLYRELKQKDVLTQEQKSYSKMISEMDEDQAAAALAIIVPTDPELIKVIFGGMSKERQALILSAMESQVAAQTIKILSPDIEIN